MIGRHIPNLITTARIVLIWPICWHILQHDFLPALSFVIIAGISDGLDGYVARHCNWQTRLGSFLDPAADKVFIIVCFAVLTWIKAIPIWLFAIILLKDITIAIGAIVYHYLVASYEFAATTLSKWNTFIQIVFLLVVLVKLHFVTFPQVIVSSFMYIVLLTTILCMCDYVWVWGRRAYRKTHHSS